MYAPQSIWFASSSSTRLVWSNLFAGLSVLVPQLDPLIIAM